MNTNKSKDIIDHQSLNIETAPEEDKINGHTQHKYTEFVHAKKIPEFEISKIFCGLNYQVLLWQYVRNAFCIVFNMGRDSVTPVGKATKALGNTVQKAYLYSYEPWQSKSIHFKYAIMLIIQSKEKQMLRKYGTNKATRSPEISRQQVQKLTPPPPPTHTNQKKKTLNYRYFLYPEFCFSSNV